MAAEGYASLVRGRGGRTSHSPGVEEKVIDATF